MTMRYDDIGYWSEVKLDIVREFATAYSTILSAQRGLYHLYVDAFAGAGVHISRVTNDYVAGSPLNALNIQPPFKEFHFIDIEGTKVESLRALVGAQPNVFLYQGDCNDILIRDVFPRVRFEDFRRALCLLDPYGLHLDWRVIESAGRLGTVDMFLNFPSMDMNRNVLWRNPERVPAYQVARMNAFWGDESWRSVAYNTQSNLFGLEMKPENSNEVVVNAFRQRLRDVAKFAFVPEALPMRNTSGAIVYYLVFASPKAVAGEIVTSIFKKYGQRGLSR